MSTELFLCWVTPVPGVGGTRTSLVTLSVEEGVCTRFGTGTRSDGPEVRHEWLVVRVRESSFPSPYPFLLGAETVLPSSSTPCPQGGGPEVRKK